MCEIQTVLWTTAPRHNQCYEPKNKRKERDCANGLDAYLLLTDGSMDE